MISFKSNKATIKHRSNLSRGKCRFIQQTRKMNRMKKSILYIAGIMILFAGCKDIDFIDPTNENEGPTSLTAIFTSGTYEDDEAEVYTITDQTATDFVIPIPYYYPEESDSTTEQYMTAMKVKAGLAANCTLSPALGVLDLTKKNYFTYTDESGNSRQISISGEMTKSDECELLSFSLPNEGISGVVDEDTKIVSLVTTEDLSSCTASYSISSHATISPDPTQSLNYNDTVSFTVTADNGTDSAVYKVVKSIPDKISYGFRSASPTSVYTVDLTNMGLPSESHPSLAALDDYLIVDYGDGSTPLYFNKTTGSKLGSITIGNATPDGCVASDNGDNILISNYVESGETLKIYKTQSVTATPTSYITFTNTTGFPMGARMSVQGDLSTDAIITSVCDGTSVSGASSYVRWIVSNGVVQSPEVITLSDVSTWGGLDGDAKVVYRSSSVSGGSFVGHYDSGNDNIYYLNSSNSVVSYLAGQSDGTGWGMNNGILDARSFNSAKYLALYSVGYFPQWSMNSSIYLYDVTSTSSFSDYVDTSSALVFSLSAITSSSSEEPSEPRTGDVLLQVSSNGYYLYLFYIDNTCKTLGCYSFDCIDK